MENNYMWIPFFVGMVFLLIASAMQWYCDFSRQALPEYRPKVFNTRWGLLLEFGWILLLLLGATFIFWADLFAPFSGGVLTALIIIAYWVLLPLSVIPRLRRRLLPRWSAVKKDLEKLGYSEYNYWRGDWWRKKKDKKRKEEGKGGEGTDTT